MKNMMKKILALATILALCLAMCAPALASTGDRMLKRLASNDGLTYSSINAVLQTNEGICIVMNGEREEIHLYRELGGEPEIYVTDISQEEQMASYLDYYLETVETETEEENTSFETPTTVCYFSWKGVLYSLQAKYVRQEEGQTVEGGWAKKVVFGDGKFTLEDSDLPQLDWTYMVEDSDIYQYSRWLSRTAVVGDRLLGLTYDDMGQTVVLAFDLNDGSCEEIDLTDVSWIYPGPGDDLLTVRYEWSDVEPVARISRLNLESKDEEEICSMVATYEEIPTGLCWREENNTLYYIQDGQVWAAAEMDFENAVSVNDCPQTYNEVNTLMLPDGFLLIWNSTVAMVRNTDPSQRSNITLVIQDQSYADSLVSAVYDFSNNRGDVSVVLRRGGDLAGVLQAMMNRDAQVDIYSMSYESSEFEALRTRGYLADLGINATITEAVDRMYPFVQDALRKDGKIIALPVGMYGHTLGYNTRLWKELGGTEEELPKTWSQFFDWLNKLPEKLEGKEGVQAFDMWMDKTSIRASMLSMILEQYQAYLNRGDREYAFNTPEIRELLEKLDNLDYEALGIPERSMDEDEEGGYIDYDEYKEPLLNTYSEITISSWASETQPLCFSFREDEAPLTPVEMTVVFVNPYSEHAEEAAELLSLTLKNLRTADSYSLFADKTEPIRWPNFEESKSYTENWLKMAKEKLADVTDEEKKAELEETIRMEEEYLANMDENDWMISPAAVESYRKRVDGIQVLSYDFTSSMVSSDGSVAYYELADAYAAGQSSAEELLSMIDKKVQMMRLEGN